MRRVAAACLTVVLIAGGCLDFDSQTVYFEHDAANDRVLMIVTYRGFYAAAHDDRSGVEDARQQLAEAVNEREVAFGGNWPFVYSNSEWTRPPEGDAAKAPTEVGRIRRELAETVTVLNAGFYRDSAGRPCGAQVLVVEPAQRAVELVNRAINAALIAQADDAPAKDEWMKTAVRRARQGHRWVRLEGHSILADLPADEQQLKRALEDLAEKSEAPVAALLTTPVLLWYEEGHALVRAGLPPSPFRTPLKPPAGDYRPNLEQHIGEEYGYRLDSLLAHYLVEPDAPADEEAERAAKLMAPRLSRRHRIRALLHALEKEPSEALRRRLREEGAPGSRDPGL